MQAENNHSVIRLFNLLAMEGGEDFFNSVSGSFRSLNPDVEQFFKDKAVQSTKLRTSATYIVYSFEQKFDILGYFTLATKMLTLKQSGLSKSERKEISRFGYFDDESESYKLPAILVAQFSRNFHENSKSIKGSHLMEITLNSVDDILRMTSGKMVFLECEPEKKILDFYETAGFRQLGSTMTAKNDKELVQLYRIL